MTSAEYFEQLNALLPAKCDNGTVLIPKLKCVDGVWKVIVETPTGMEMRGGKCPCKGWWTRFKEWLLKPE